MDGTGKATTVVRIFESYGWKDASDIAGRLRDSLQQAGYEVWIDREHLRADDKHFSIALEQAVADSEVVIALLSPHSVRGLGAHDDRASICYNEIRLAEELARPIVPVRVQRFTGAAPLLIIKYRILDWLDWQDPDRYQNGLAEVLAAVEAAEARELMLDRDISLQTSNFASQLRTAADDFTGRDWLFDGLAQWLDSAQRCLRLEGVTGTGKTAVVAELVRRNPGGRLLAFHFCTPLQLGAVGFVRSLAGMLAASIDEYADLLNSGRLAHQLNSSDPSTMLLDGVLEPLRMVPVDGRYFIAVDALDEAIGADAQMSIPVLLAHHVDDFPPWLKLMITCRPQQRVQGLFGTAEVWSLDDDTAQRADLSSYLQRRLVDPEVKQRIEDRAAGNFQYASTVLDALAAGEIDAAELDALPRRLEVFYYRRAVQRFPTAAAYPAGQDGARGVGGSPRRSDRRTAGRGHRARRRRAAVGARRGRLFRSGPVRRVAHSAPVDRGLADSAGRQGVSHRRGRRPGSAPRVLPEMEVEPRSVRADACRHPSAGRRTCRRRGGGDP